MFWLARVRSGPNPTVNPPLNSLCARIERLGRHGISFSRAQSRLLAFADFRNRRCAEFPAKSKYTGLGYTSFPNRAFAAFVARIIDVPKYEELVPDYVPPPRPESTTEPQWMLPLMRVMKTIKPQSWLTAKEALQRSLPGDTSMPTDHELQAAYRRLNRS